MQNVWIWQVQINFFHTSKGTREIEETKMFWRETFWGFGFTPSYKVPIEKESLTSLEKSPDCTTASCGHTLTVWGSFPNERTEQLLPNLTELNWSAIVLVPRDTDIEYVSNCCWWRCGLGLTDGLRP